MTTWRENVENFNLTTLSFSFRSRDMPLDCPPPGSCGTQAPVWLDLDSLPQKRNQTIEVDACVSWGFEDLDGQSDCCLFTLPITVKNCGNFNVYYLGPTQACSIAYCSQAIQDTAHAAVPNSKEDRVQNGHGSNELGKLGKLCPIR